MFPQYDRPEDGKTHLRAVPSGRLAKGAGARALVLSTLITLAHSQPGFGAPTDGGVAGEPAPPPAILFIDFARPGVTVKEAVRDDASTYQSVLGALPAVTPFSWPGVGKSSGTDEARVAAERVLIAQLHRSFLPYNLLIADERPVSPPYSAILVSGGGSPFPDVPNALGLAPLDCRNLQDNNLAFAFAGAARGDIRSLFVTIAQEAAHAFGLEHTTDPQDIMFPVADPLASAFTNRTSFIDPPRFCGSQTQNSHALLLSNVGRWRGGRKPLASGRFPDIEGPELRIVRPAAGGVTTPPFVVEVHAWDRDKPQTGDAGVATPASGLRRLTARLSGQSTAIELVNSPVGLEVDPGVDLAPAAESTREGVYRHIVTAAEAGPTRLTVTAEDALGNRTTRVIAFNTLSPASGGCSMPSAERSKAPSITHFWILFGAGGLLASRLVARFFRQKRKPGVVEGPPDDYKPSSFTR